MTIRTHRRRAARVLITKAGVLLLVTRNCRMLEAVETTRRIEVADGHVTGG